MIFGKLVEDRIIEYKSPYNLDGREVFTDDPEILANYGYYPIQYTTKPEHGMNQIISSYGVLEHNRIIQRWLVKECEGDELTTEEALQIIGEGE